MLIEIKEGETYKTFCGTFRVENIQPNGSCDCISADGTVAKWNVSRIREALDYERVREDPVLLEAYNHMCATGEGIEDYKAQHGF